MKAKIRGAEIYFDIAGMQVAPHKDDFIERPVMFMLHGGPGGNHLRYKMSSLELQDVAQLVFIDHRGCGRSKPTRQSDYTMENNIEDIEALRQHLGLNKICILGTSYGGMVAQGYAIRYPKNLDKLILVATGPSYRGLDESKEYLKTIGTPEQIKMAEHVWNGTFKSHKHVMEFFKLFEDLYTVSLKKNRKMTISKSKAIWNHEALNEGFGGFLRKFDFIPKLKKITCPTLLLGGEDDWIMRPTQMRIIAKHIPHAELKIYKNCGHSVAVDAHDKYIKTIKNFFKNN
jgi:proline iminopeptidase